MPTLTSEALATLAADVAAALAAARDELWHAPCDVDVAEAALAKLSALLRATPGGDR